MNFSCDKKWVQEDKCGLCSMGVFILACHCNSSPRSFSAPCLFSSTFVLLQDLLLLHFAAQFLPQLKFTFLADNSPLDLVPQGSLSAATEDPQIMPIWLWSSVTKCRARHKRRDTRRETCNWSCKSANTYFLCASTWFLHQWNDRVHLARNISSCKFHGIGLPRCIVCSLRTPGVTVRTLTHVASCGTRWVDTPAP